MDAESPTTTNNLEEYTIRMAHAGAEACGVAYEIVEKICPASPEQGHRMDHHINTGSSYMMQMVVQYEGDLNPAFLLRVLSAMRFKNHILRTRLIKLEGQVYQIVLKDSIVAQTGCGLRGYLVQNSRTRMDYGAPLFRHAFIQEPDGEAFFVWTAHCSAVDAWTLRLIFDDLQTACSDLEAYIKVPPRPPYGRYVRWLESYAYEARFTYWLARHTVFDNLVHKFPVLGSVEVIPICTVQTKKLLHLPKGEDTEFSLPIMGHAAWALVIANYEYPPRLNEDVSFISMRPARMGNPSGIKDMMGPISARIPLKIHFFPDLPIENLMRDIESQFSSMVGFEHCAMKALSKGVGFQNMVKQAVFNWNPPDSDLTSKRIVCHDKEAAPAVLAYREDLSMPEAHDYGLMFEVYEHGEHITIYATWDHNLIPVNLRNWLFMNFESFLSSIIKTRGKTVLELISENKLDASVWASA